MFQICTRCNRQSVITLPVAVCPDIWKLNMARVRKLSIKTYNTWRQLPGNKVTVVKNIRLVNMVL